MVPSKFLVVRHLLLSSALYSLIVRYKWTSLVEIPVLKPYCLTERILNPSRKFCIRLWIILSNNFARCYMRLIVLFSCPKISSLSVDIETSEFGEEYLIMLVSMLGFMGSEKFSYFREEYTKFVCYFVRISQKINIFEQSLLIFVHEYSPLLYMPVLRNALGSLLSFSISVL